MRGTPRIESRSRRNIWEAMLLGRVYDQTHFGETFLRLLVAGVDHEMVGTSVWYRVILSEAPDARPRTEKA